MPKTAPMLCAYNDQVVICCTIAGMYIYKVAQWSKRILKSVNYNLLTTRQLTVLRSPNAASIKTYLDEKQFVYREGHTSFMIDCPICDKTVKEKNGVVGYGVHVNKTTGSVVCQPCKMSGKYFICHICTKNFSWISWLFGHHSNLILNGLFSHYTTDFDYQFMIAEYNIAVVSRLHILNNRIQEYHNLPTHASYTSASYLAIDLIGLVLLFI